MSIPWVEALVAVDEEVVACERRFHRQCARVGAMAAKEQATAEDEMLLASYLTSFTLIRAHRDSLLADAATDA